MAIDVCYLLCRYSRTTSPTLRTFIVVVILAVLIALPSVVIDRVVSFHRDHTVRNAVEWKTANNLTYPSITICNSKFFEKSRLQGTSRFILAFTIQ